MRFLGGPDDRQEGAAAHGALQRCDLLIVGGGVNGAGIARDAAGRGLKVVLVEQGDFGGATSSASTKLIHGGLRYLEHREFRLVAEALSERELLLRLASHIARPLRFVMPHVPQLRPAWMIRAGLWLYDRIGGRSSLPRSAAVKLTPDGVGAGLSSHLQEGYAYSDAWVDDARLVILNVCSAHAHGARVLRSTRLVSAQRGPGGWTAKLQSSRHVEPQLLQAGVIVNAAGPWVCEVSRACGVDGTERAMQLVKGSHIVVPRIHAQAHAYVLQNVDRRIIFMIPYERNFTLIGTTDVAVKDASQARAIDNAEVHYLLDAVNRYLARPLRESDVVWSYSGVRPLFDDGSADPSAVSRDYTLDVDARDGAALLTVYGGKITTYRRLAEAALDKLAPHLPARRAAWTDTELLPGAPADAPTAFAALCERFPEQPNALLQALFQRHGTLTEAVLNGARTPAELGRDFGAGLYAREVKWFFDREWAESADDVLWRRTKTGLHMSASQRAAFAAWFIGLGSAA